MTPASRSEVSIIYTDDPTRGICGECGNGMWPDQAPCVHKKARMTPEQLKKAHQAKKKRRRKNRKEKRKREALARMADPRYKARNAYEAIASGAIYGITYEERGLARSAADAERRKYGNPDSLDDPA